jgi:hemerythrin-like domain-containing protein
MEGSRVASLLHDEHMAVAALLKRLDAALRGAAEGHGGSLDGALLTELAAAVEGEIAAHFAFEEMELFPRLDAAGAGTLGAMLAEEHAVIMPLGRRLAGLAREASADGLGGAALVEFVAKGAEFVERLGDHIDKEEAGLAPALEDAMAEAEDARLAAAHDGG